MAKKSTAPKKLFKIRHKKTGLFSTGGSYVHLDGVRGWNAKGKVWVGLGPVKNHLAQYLPKNDPNRFQKNIGAIRDDWEIIEIEVVFKALIPMTDIYNDFDIIQRVAK